MSTTTVAIFRNLRISLAGVDDHRRKKASKIVGFLGGEVTDNCLSGLNCSIVDKVGSAAFLKAQDLNITTVTIQWLYDCYKFRKVLAFEEYKLKPLQGLVVSCSQLDNHDRLKLEQAVLENGGTFSPELSKEKCTHLIVDFPKGDKYQHAKLWRSIHIVSKSWIDDVVKAQSNNSHLILR